jgi:hypothetical protein
MVCLVVRMRLFASCLELMVLVLADGATGLTVPVFDSVDANIRVGRMYETRCRFITSPRECWTCTCVVCAVRKVF